MVTLDEKRKLLGNFEYEVRMIVDGIKVIDPHTGVVPNIVLVGLLTHIRNLFEFFHGNEYEKRNGHAKHYISNWDKTATREIGIWNGKINIFVSHLTYERARTNWEPWPIPNLLYPHYRRLIIKFLMELPADYRSVQTDNLLEYLRDS